MFLSPEQIQQICGILLCNDFNTFIYYCTKCRCEFGSGKELEEHIVFDHHDEKKFVDGIFVDDGIVLNTTTKLAAVPFVPLVETEIIPRAIAVATVPADQTNDFATESAVEVDDKSGLKVPYKTQNEAISKEESIGSSSSSNASPVENGQNHGKHQKEIFYCDICPDRTFSSLAAIKVHIKRHAMNELREQCRLCPIRPRNMEKHLQYAHTEAKPYKCDFCTASFKNNFGRVVHMRMHTGERPYLCATCGKSFKSEDTRKKHDTRMHSEQLPHPCTKCDRCFTLPSLLQEHINSMHTKERPYTCERCGLSYSTRKNLRKHHQSHGEKIHLCNFCGTKFKTTESRRWHLRNVHKILKN